MHVKSATVENEPVPHVYVPAPEPVYPAWPSMAQEVESDKRSPAVQPFVLPVWTPVPKAGTVQETHVGAVVAANVPAVHNTVDVPDQPLVEQVNVQLLPVLTDDAKQSVV